MYDVEFGALTHGVVYTLDLDDGTDDSGEVQIVTVIDGNSHKWGFPEGDYRSG